AVCGYKSGAVSASQPGLALQDPLAAIHSMAALSNRFTPLALANRHNETASRTRLLSDDCMVDVGQVRSSSNAPAVGCGRLSEPRDARWVLPRGKARRPGTGRMHAGRLPQKSLDVGGGRDDKSAVGGCRAETVQPSARQ